MIRLEVPGSPAPKGSGRAMMFGGRARLIASGSTANQRKLASWKAEMLAAIEEQCGESRRTQDMPAVRWSALPVAVACVFRFPMRKGDLRSNGQPKPAAPAYLTSKPDVDKLLRSTLDAITAAGCIWRDDSQAIVLGARVYAPPGAPLVSTVLLGVDIGEVTATWQNALRRAEIAVFEAKQSTHAETETERPRR